MHPPDDDAMGAYSLDGLRCGSMALDPAGRITCWSAGLEDMLGYAEPEVRGTPVSRFWAGDGSEAARALLAAAAADGSAADRVEQWVRRDGERFDVRLVAHAISHEMVCLTVIDPALLRRDLRDRAALVRLMQAVTGAANESSTLEEALRAALTAVCKATGWEVGHALLLDESRTLVSSGVLCVPDEPDHSAFVEACRAVRFRAGEGVAGRVAATGEPEFVRDVAEDASFLRAAAAAEAGVHSGLFFPILAAREVLGVMEFFSTSIVEPAPALLEVMASAGAQLGRAVERSRADVALRRSEAKFAGIISISTDAVVSVGEDQRILFFNRGAEQIFGWRPEEVLGERLEVLIPERFRAGHEAQVHEFGRSGVEARRMGERGQISGLRRSGETFPADASISRLDLGDERIYTAVVRDVTERHRAEEALARQADELARSNAELEQFAYVASHDLQEPLRMVSSFTQLLAKRYGDRLDDDGREFIGFAVDGVRRMQALINDLLAYSRVGTRGGGFVATDAEAILQRVLASLGPAVEEAEATVTRDPLPTVTADPLQLEQVFQNLVGNAVKFRGAEPPRVHVSVREDGGEWTFSVRDNGIGIEPEFAQRIFIIFQRLHGREAYPGTGIGLAICKKIVERHDGRIWMESEPGRGTTFYFTIPKRDEDE